MTILTSKNIFIPQQLLILYYMPDTLVITKKTRVKHLMSYVTEIKDYNISGKCWEDSSQQCLFPIML